MTGAPAHAWAVAQQCADDRRLPELAAPTP